MNVDKDNKKYNECMDENEFIYQILCSENDEDDDEIKRNIYEDMKKKDECHSHKEESKIRVNCNLKVDFDTKNKMIYLYPGRSQFFTADVFKCCGDVTIKYKGCSTGKGMRGNLAIYKIVQSGIIAEAYGKLDPRKKDILYFTATDECTEECYDFVVIFSSKLCDYRY